MKAKEYLEALARLDFVNKAEFKGAKVISVEIKNFNYKHLEDIKAVIDDIISIKILMNDKEMLLTLKTPVKDWEKQGVFYGTRLEDIKHELDYEADSCQRYDDEMY